MRAALDDDLAERVGKDVGNSISRSVSYLAAPAFAAAMLEHQVLRTIAVGRHVLLIAEVAVNAGAELDGRRRRRRPRVGDVRVIALRRRGAAGSTGRRGPIRAGGGRTGWWCWPPGPGWAGSWRAAGSR